MLTTPSAVILIGITMLISATIGLYLSRYKSSVTEMLGMMIGMTQGMMTGITVGYFAGAATDMFVANLIGVGIGLLFGIAFGRVGGLMGMMDGGMGGMMGGMMGAMLGVMLQYLYDGNAIRVTGVVMGLIYVASMIALVRLVQQAASRSMEIDLVCDMKVDPRSSLQHVYQSRTYYFCAPSCQRAFARAPEKYAREVNSTNQQVQDPAEA